MKMLIKTEMERIDIPRMLHSIASFDGGGGGEGEGREEKIHLLYVVDRLGVVPSVCRRRLRWGTLLLLLYGNRRNRMR
jgi:hypothetical protein